MERGGKETFLVFLPFVGTRGRSVAEGLAG